jgi:hypothetical protein
VKYEISLSFLSDFSFVLPNYIFANALHTHIILYANVVNLAWNSAFRTECNTGAFVLIIFWGVIISLVRSPRLGSTPRHTDWLTVSCKVTLTLTDITVLCICREVIPSDGITSLHIVIAQQDASHPPKGIMYVSSFYYNGSVGSSHLTRQSPGVGILAGWFVAGISRRGHCGGPPQFWFFLSMLLTKETIPHFFCNPILFAVCKSTFTKLCNDWKYIMVHCFNVP